MLEVAFVYWVKPFGEASGVDEEVNILPIFAECCECFGECFFVANIEIEGRNFVLVSFVKVFFYFFEAFVTTACEDKSVAFGSETRCNSLSLL